MHTARGKVSSLTTEIDFSHVDFVSAFFLNRDSNNSERLVSLFIHQSKIVLLLSLSNTFNYNSGYYIFYDTKY